MLCDHWVERSAGIRNRCLLLAILFALASLLVPGIASAGTTVGAETRVGASDLAEQVHVGVERSASPELPPGCGRASDDLASDSLLVPRGTAARTPVGRRGNPLNVAVPEGRTALNSPATINGRQFSGHALDRLQGQGIPPSVAEGAIRPGNAIPGKVPGTTAYYDSVNNVTVITDTASGRVVTVDFGRIKQ